MPEPTKYHLRYVLLTRRRRCLSALALLLLLSPQFVTAAEIVMDTPATPAVSAAQSLSTPETSTNATLLAEATDAFREAGEREATHPQQARELYQGAAMRYEQLIRNGIHNGKIFYNLGNTQFKLGSYGKAILSYKQAQRYMPADDNLRHNLERARAQRADRIAPREDTRIIRTLFFWHYDLPTPVREYIFATLFLLFWTGMIIRRLWPKKRLPRIWQLVALCVLWGALLSSLLVQPLETASCRDGVITAREIIARKGNGEHYQPAFKQPLHEGTEFQLIEERPGWLEVLLPDGRNCWLPTDSAELIRAH